MLLLSRFRALLRGESSNGGGYSSPRQIHHLPASFRPEVERSPIPYLDDISVLQRYERMAQYLRLSLPSTCRWLDPEGVNFVGESPIAAGGFADIHGATHVGLKVVVKLYRCYESFDVARAVARFHSEIHIWSLLHHGAVKVVPLVGVYSTEKHPFGLVYRYMEGLDLRQYMRSKPNIGRLQLLIDLARGLKRMHDLGVVHGALEMANVLVDKDGTIRIAGLGDAYILPYSAVCTAAGRTNADRAVELTWPGIPQNPANPTYPTKAGDMYAFGLIALEVLTGRQPFSEMTKIAAMHLMLKGARPPRQNHHELSDRVWYIIQRCWHNVSSKRMLAGEAVNLLELELGRTCGSRALSRVE